MGSGNIGCGAAVMNEVSNLATVNLNVTALNDGATLGDLNPAAVRDLLREVKCGKLSTRESCF